MTEKHLTDIRFDSFGLPEKLAQGVEDTGFSFCTPIQAETIPIALEGRDVAGQAQTGTGKTAAFLLATFHNLLTKPDSEERKLNQPRALILAPTRELAIQIHKDAEVLGRHTGSNSAWFSAAPAMSSSVNSYRTASIFSSAPRGV